MTHDTNKQALLGQYMTPPWVADALYGDYFGDLTSNDRVWEPTCGRGSWLHVVPDHIPAIGTEIDPVLAEQAMRSSGRPVIVGDFRAAELPWRPTAIIGNPPFSLKVVTALLDRAHALMSDGSRCGLVLPCFLFQTARTVVDISKRWSLRADFIPRNIFTGLSHPLCFAMLTKGASGKLFNFALYFETNAVQQLQRRYRELLANGEKSVWAAVTIAALEKLGGRASLHDIYREIEGHRPTDNQWWRAQVRKQLQSVAERIGPSEWGLPGDWTTPFQPSLIAA
jgi:site-specific DNA-methyltransferase (adenine-specific)